MAPSQAEIISIQPVAIPGRARDVDEGAALRRGFELAFARRHEGGRQFGDLAQAGVVARRRGAVRLRQKHAVAKSGAIGQHRSQPVAQARRRQ